MNIDRIAREMVDVEPSVNLEARIRARLDDVQPGRTVPFGWRVAVPLAIAATVVLAFIVQRPASRVPSPTSQVPNVATSQVSNVASELPNVPTSKVAVVHTPRRSKVPTSLLTAEELAWMDRRLPALDPVNALQMDRLRVNSIQPEPLAITPLTMMPVATESGGIERRNDR